jgi:serine/threonine protein kinase/Tol biopolymer transport system component
VIGRRLSHYRIEERLGAGGMGEVYRARDEKLGRDVALKVLPSGALADDEARRRFRKEAVVLARLSHPHVATLHDFDSAEGTDFLVMELVVGPTLEQELRKGPLAEKDVVRLGTQLARGLQAAHEQGVIHRDLKPSNLQLTADGLLKVLDFGVAHLQREGPPTGGEATATETAAGGVLGSPPYMAPEQLLGKPVDARTDLYAAGACLYELATGKRPYGEKRGALLTEAILHEPPVAPRSVNSSVSPGLEAVILKALDKDAGLRYQTAKELLVDLERLQAATTGSASQPVVMAKPRRRWPWLVGAAALVAIAALAWLLRPLPPPRIIETHPITRGLDPTVSNLGGPLWTTDGVRLYYLDGAETGQAELFQAPLAGGEPATIPLPFRYYRRILAYLPRESALLMSGSEVDPPPSPNVPGWIVSVPSGTATRTPLRAHCAAISADGERLVWIADQRILVGRPDGSEAQELLALESNPHNPSWSPDGQRIRFDATGPEGGARWIWETSATGGAPRLLWTGEAGRWTGDGRYFVFQRRDPASGRDDLWAVREHRRLSWSRSEPERLTSGPVSFAAVGSSADGRRLFARGQTDRAELVRYDAATRRFVPYLGGASVTFVAPSPDGRWLAGVDWPLPGGLWRGRPDGSDRLKLTPPGWSAVLPRWSPDGTRVAFAGAPTEAGPASLYVVAVDGGVPQRVAEPQAEGSSIWDSCWLPDGGSVVFSHRGFGGRGLYRVDVRSRRLSRWPGAERLQWQKCSAQGAILAFERPGEGEEKGRAWVTRDERGIWENLGPLYLTYPNWTADGQSVIGIGADRTIARFSFATRRLEAVADLSGLRMAPTGGVYWMGLAPDDSPLILRDRSTSDIYALEWEAP